MKKIKLQTRFFLTYLLLALTLVTLFAFFFYFYTSGILIERETENIVNLVSGFQEQTDEAVRTLDSVSINIGYSNLIKETLEKHFEHDNISWSTKSTLAELVVAINGTDIRVEQINIYDFFGNVIGFGRSSFVGKISLQDTDWYKPAYDLYGHKYVSLPYRTDSLSKTTGEDISYISLYRVYFNKYGRASGFVETIQSCKSIFKSIITYSKKYQNGPSVYVFNRDGTLIYPYEAITPQEYSACMHYYNSLSDDTDHILITNPETNVRELIAFKKSAYTGWIYVTVMPEETILKPVKILFELLIWVIILLLFISIALSYYMSKSLTRPIKMLRNMIRETELETLGTHKDSSLNTSIDELEELNRAFQKMSTNLKASMDELIYTRQQEIKARNVALQSQINPHFYYNSLSSIIVLAENNQCGDVITLCRNLGSIMRYITKDFQTVVTLKEETDYIQKYLYCMKIRYQSSLNYSISIDESIMNIEIPKLIIQPLVENAIKHGTDCEPPWFIHVKSTVNDRFWRIDVIDNGAGFSQDVIAMLNRNIEKINEKGGIPEVETDGIGLLNVYLRWKLYCGENIIFSFGNSENGGGIVSIGRFFDQTS